MFGARAGAGVEGRVPARAGRDVRRHPLRRILPRQRVL